MKSPEYLRILNPANDPHKNEQPKNVSVEVTQDGSEPIITNDIHAPVNIDNDNQLVGTEIVPHDGQNESSIKESDVNALDVVTGGYSHDEEYTEESIPEMVRVINLTLVPTVDLIEGERKAQDYLSFTQQIGRALDDYWVMISHTQDSQERKEMVENWNDSIKSSVEHANLSDIEPHELENIVGILQGHVIEVTDENEQIVLSEPEIDPAHERTFQSLGSMYGSVAQLVTVITNARDEPDQHELFNKHGPSIKKQYDTQYGIITSDSASVEEKELWNAHLADIKIDLLEPHESELGTELLDMLQQITKRTVDVPDTVYAEQIHSDQELTEVSPEEIRGKLSRFVNTYTASPDEAFARGRLDSNIKNIYNQTQKIIYGQTYHTENWITLFEAWHDSTRDILINDIHNSPSDSYTTEQIKFLNSLYNKYKSISQQPMD